MILVDTSVWIDHLRVGDKRLTGLLDKAVDPSFRDRRTCLGQPSATRADLSSLQDLPSATVATDRELLHFVAENALEGRGIGYVDAHLLASAKLTVDTLLWTRDKRLRTAAASLRLVMPADA